MSKLELHLAALAAATAGMGLATQADAAIVYSGVVNINIPSTTSGIYLNVVTGVSGGSSTPGWDVNPWSGSALNMFSTATQGGSPGNTRYAGTGATYFNLAPGAIIGPAATFGGVGTNTINAGTPLNLNSSNNLVGFQFLNELTGAVHYGWMRIALGGTPGGQPRSIVEYAYESQPGVAIAAKDGVPTPGAASLLAIGAAGLVGRRRRA